MNYTDVISAPRREFRDRPTFVSLYSGCGGLDLGFSWAGFRGVWANDVDPIAIDTYRTLMPDHMAVVGDVSTMRERPRRGAADVVIGGPPCQGFSVAGRMDPADPRSRHVLEFLDVVAAVRPSAFVMENVKALACSPRWTTLREELIEEARSLGFTVQLFLLNAAQFGVPQARERMFLVGVRRGNGSLRDPHDRSVSGTLTVRSAFERLPRVGAPGNDTICTARIVFAKNPVLRPSPWAGMLFNGAGRPMDAERPAPTLPASMGGNRTPIVDQDQLDTAAEPWIVRYHGELRRGRESRKRVPNRLRRITVEEAAALQSFPPLTWSGPQSARYRQIGNAVPPELAYRVALALRDTLGLDEGSARGTARAA